MLCFVLATTSPTGRAALALALAATLATLAAAAPAAAEPPSGLTAREAAAVRKALYGLNAALLRNGREETILRETWIGSPSLDEQERERIRAHLAGHLPTMRAAQEVLNLRLYWRNRSTEHFVFWWNPTYRDERGLPARSPTTEEAMALEEVAVAAGERLGVDAPEWLPYRIDPRQGSARAYPREDLRWGVWAPDAGARAAVVQAVARERGGVPGLWEPLGALLGTCHEDPACRESMLRRAAEMVSEAGLVGLIEVFTAGQLGGPQDPAHASALLYVDLLDRERPPELLGELLEALRPDLGPEGVRRALRAELGESPRRLEKAMERRMRGLGGAESGR